MNRWLLSIFLAFFITLPNGAFSQDIAVEAEVNIRRVVLDSFVRLTITIHGAQNIAPVNLPDIEGFESRYLGPSHRTSIINGHRRSSVSFSYSLFPVKAGTFQIPAIPVTIEGQQYLTDPIAIEVLDSPSSSVSGSLSSGIQDKVFVALKISKEEAYLNEKIPVKILLFVRDTNIRDIQFPDLKAVGVTVEEFSKPLQYTQMIQGLRYEIVEFNTVIYPTRTGKIMLGPVTLECNQILRSSRQRGSPFGGGFFDDDFFNSFFDSYEKRPLTLSSQEITLNVLPFPQDGKPENFSGAVGPYAFDVSVSPLEVSVGDPITLRMTLTGEGNLSSAQFPKFQHPNQFKTYEPNIKEENGTKILEQVIIPRSDTITEIPSLEFSYFDTDLKKYRTLAKGPFSIKVRPAAGPKNVRIVGLDEEASVPERQEQLGRDIVFIKSLPGTLRKINRPFYATLPFLLMIIFSGIGFGGMVLYYQRTQRLETDVVYARRLLAPKKAKRELIAAKALIQQNQTRKFYDALFKAFQHYLGNKFHLSSGAVTVEKVQSCLTDAKHVKACEAIQNIFEEFDTVRYASMNIDQKQMQTMYKKVEQIIDYLERHL